MSNRIVLNLDKTSKLKFENKIIGTDSKPNSFFTIPITEKLSLSIKGNDKTEDGKLISEIEIPPLKEFFNESKIVKNAKLNIQVSKSLFESWVGEVEMNIPMRVETCLKESTEESSNEPNVSLVAVEQSETDVVEESSFITKKKKFKANNFANDYI